MKLHNTLDKIIVSRTFTIYQLKSLLLRELPKVIEKYQPSVVIVPGLLDLFEDPNIKKKEAKLVIARIMKTISDISNRMLVIASLQESKYADLAMPSFEKRIELRAAQNNRLNAKLYNRGRNENITLTERELKIVRTK